MFELMQTLIELLDRGEQPQTAGLSGADRDQMIARADFFRTGRGAECGCGEGVRDLRQLVDGAPLKNGGQEHRQKRNSGKGTSQDQ